jgi:hypothetical protein
MKKIIFILLLLTSFRVHAQDLKNLDEEYGFRGHKFGSLISTFKNMVFVTGTGEIKNFQDRNEDFGIGGGTATKITYEFYKNKYFKVKIEAKGEKNSHGILERLQTQYGPGKKGGGGTKGDKYTWLGTKAMIEYKETSLTHDATIEIFSKEIADRVDKDADRQGE